MKDFGAFVVCCLQGLSILRFILCITGNLLDACLLENEPILLGVMLMVH